MSSGSKRRRTHPPVPGPGRGSDRPISARLQEIRDWVDRGGDGDPEGLIERLEEPESVLRQAAAWGLGQLKVHRSREALERALRDPEGPVRALAAGALGALGRPQSRPALERALQDTVPRVREQAAWALWVLADRRSEPRLLPLLDDPEPSVRWSAAVTLGRVGGPAAVDALRLATGDPHDRVRREALLALAHLRPEGVGEVLRPFLSDPAVRVRIAAAVGLGEQRDASAVPLLLERLRVEADAQVLPAVIVALGRAGDPSAVPALLDFVEHRTSWSRVCAFHALAELAAPEAAAPARVHLQDPVWSVRGAAAECLGEVGNLDDMEVLFPLLQDPQMWARRGAIYALGRLGASGALPQIRSSLADTEPEVRLAAIWAVGRLADRESRDALLALLQDPAAHLEGGTTFSAGDSAITLESDARDRLFDAVVQALGRIQAQPPDRAISSALVAARRRLPASELRRHARLPAPEGHRGATDQTLRELFVAAMAGRKA